MGGFLFVAYDVLDVANYIVGYCNKSTYQITNLRLQKLLYFVQGDFLACKDIPCFDNKLEAWDFGPVAPDAYYFFRVFSSQPIPTIYSDPVKSWTAKNVEQANKIIKSEDQEEINIVIESMKNYSTYQLVDITHSQDPWRNAYNNPFDKTITQESIRLFFKAEKAKQND